MMEDASIYILSDSQLLLSHNSHLNVSANKGKFYGGRIHVSYAGKSVQTLNELICGLLRITLISTIAFVQDGVSFSSST